MRKNKGFTLMEMLIIVGMIAVLIAIGYPVFSNVMEKNKENADIAAMHSAEALMESAYNTRLKIEGTSIQEAKATDFLYYDPSGKLTWKMPSPYGQGTDRDGGVTWSCCDDYRYDPARDYRNSVIYCYYTPDSGENPGIHVHWTVDGYNPTAPDPVTKPTKPVFPERPPTEPTQGVEDGNTGNTGGNGNTGSGTTTTYPETPEGSWTVDQVLTTGHPYPTRATDPSVEAGHRYIYNGQVYIAVTDKPNGITSNKDYIPGTAAASYRFIIPTNRVLTSTSNVKENGDLKITDSNGNETTGVNIKQGDIFIQYIDEDTVDFYVRKSDSSHGVSPITNDSEWVKLVRLSECADCGKIHLPQTDS